MTRVAIQGIRGSYSEQAVKELLGSDASIVECLDFEETFAAFRRGEAKYAVVPVKNKIAGDIKATADILGTGEFQILDELRLRVQHVLSGTGDSTFEKLASVHSHAEALRQCGNFLAANANLTQVVEADTASSIQRITGRADPSAAAICSRRATEIYGGKILLENVADDADNWTTFYLIGN